MKPRVSHPRAPRDGKCSKTGKLRFPTEAAAKQDAKRFRKKHGPKLNQYLCIYCDGWHNGHDRSRILAVHGKPDAQRLYTGYRDRNGKPICVGDDLKWIRDITFYKTGAKAGMIKHPASEFIAGRVIKVDVEGYDYWALDPGAETEDKDTFSQLPPGLNFPRMLDYIEVIEK